MTRRIEDARILMYSHDTFGLGHFWQTSANAALAEHKLCAFQAKNPVKSEEPHWQAVTPW